METKPIYKNKQLEDLPNEEWIDVIGYDGIYNVSNLGRVKSLFRYVKCKDYERPVNERILSQHFVKSSLMCQLNNEGVGESKHVSNLVYLSFNKNSPLKPNEVIMHIDKNIYNNALTNLKIETCKESINQNFIKGVHSFDKCISNLNIANKKNKEYYDTRTHKDCNTCKKSKLLVEFIHGHSKCKECHNYQMREKRRLLKNTGA